MDLTRSTLRRLGARKPPKGLILSAATRKQVAMVERRIVRGGGDNFLALFNGPSGTGKTAAVASIRKASGRPAYRFDCSNLLSKYIGETEKNLIIVFERSERRGAILFFDEADALFGKRSKVTDTHDRYANQEVSYLLKQIRSYQGPVLFLSHDASKLKKTFLNSLDSIVEFK
ncbi:ATP-binding protein [Pelagicoccus sp. SDUM812002]|uniref:ATP-binding protein n=1 Tax=Pelagicoccus sp. SDUM812002 TaxID=3041266 RepID=UPI00281087F6|nr:ATP-binding protein [Pelagicoccus sp. SDUM812002]MDQ8188371.1 ATP-binding protein [Pelagicoccus sp. SDUM812002]